MAIDIPATKEKMELINKRAFLRAMYKKYPADRRLSPEVLTMLLNGNYPLTSYRGQQAIGYLRAEGYLVEVPDHDDSKIAA